MGVLFTPQIRQQVGDAADNQAALASLPMPSMPSFSMGQPSLPAISAPKLNVAPNQVMTDQDNLNTLRNSAPGVGQIHNPFLKGLAKTADVIGSVFAPGLATAVPGTTLHHQYLVNQAQENLTNDQKFQQQAAQTAAVQASTEHTQAETPEVAPNAESNRTLQGAETRHLNVEADSLENPLPQYEVHDTVQGPMIVNKNTGVGQHMSVNGLPIGPKIQTKEVQLEIGGKPHSVLVNDMDGSVIRDLGPSGIKPATVNVNAGEAALDREAKQFGTPYQKSLDASNAQLEKIADARAMINGNAESQGLGIPKVLTALVGGQGTGVRITQAELQAIAHARGLSGDVEGTLSKWAGQGALTKTQQAQLTQIMDDVKSRLIQKQAIASGTLDSINGGATREQIVAADKAARKQLGDLETGQQQQSGPAHSLATAMSLPFNKGKSPQQVTADLQAHGYTVVP